MTHPSGAALAALLSLAAAAPLLAAESVRYEVASAESSVTFTAPGNLATVVGSTAHVSGEVAVRPDDPADATFEIRADMASLDTGNGLRDKHLRNKYVETGRFPDAIFRGGRIEGLPFPLDTGPITATVVGTFEVHGVAQEKSIPVEIVRLEADAGHIRVTGSFDVSLSDHGIRRPSFLFVKLDDRITVSVDLTFRPAPTAP